MGPWLMFADGGWSSLELSMDEVEEGGSSVREGCSESCGEVLSVSGCAEIEAD